MSRFRRIVWNEGMLLTPHHFQQSDNHIEELLNVRVASLMPYEWGIIDLQLNRDAIANGSVQLLSCRGVMPDGLWIDIPTTCPAPEARPVEDHFSPTEDHLDVYLGVPSTRIGSANFQNPEFTSNKKNGETVRYLQDAKSVFDETNGANEQQLAFAIPNFKLIFGDETLEGYDVIKIAELERTSTGRLTLSESYVPPALNIGASAWLSDLVRQMIEFLIAKTRALGERRKQGGGGQAVFTTDDGMVLWLLPALNSIIPIMTHLYKQRITHPERLYSELASLAGALTTLVFDRASKDIQQYDHKDLYATFSKLDIDIRLLLEKIDPQRYVPIPLIQERPAVYTGRVNDDQLLREAEFYLAVGAQVPENKIIERVPFAIKIADREGIDVIINQALRGVSVTHVPPPGQIPTRVGLQYFRLDRNDLDIALKRFWDRIIAFKSISIWVADEFPEAKLELYAVKPVRS